MLSGKDYRLAQYGQTLRIGHEDCLCIDALDEQKSIGKSVFGGGLLLSERAAAAHEDRERAAENRERAAEKRAAVIVWQLSAREMNLVRRMAENL